MRIDERHNATEEAVQPGETLEIVLGENRSSGFRWRLLADGAPVLRLEKDQYHAAAQPLGAPGQHTWLMQVQTVGDATVELAYSRGWQEGQPARRFNVRVKSRSP